MRRSLALILVGSLVALLALTAPSAGAHAIVVTNRQTPQQYSAGPNTPDSNLAAASFVVAVAGIALAALQGRILGRPPAQLIMRGQLTDKQIQQILDRNGLSKVHTGQV